MSKKIPATTTVLEWSRAEIEIGPSIAEDSHAAAAAAAKSLQSCLTLRHPQKVAHQAPPSLGFSRQEQWSGLPLPSPMHESEKSK